MDIALQRALETSRAGQHAAAIAAVRRYLTLKPTSTDALNVMGLLLTQAGQTDQAVNYSSRLVELSPKSHQSHNNHANVLLMLKRNEEAARHARRAVELNPSYHLAYLTLSCALLNMQDAEGAITAARQGLTLVPESPQHAKNLILALDQSGRTEEAIAAAELAHHANPAVADLHSLLLMLLNYTGRPAAELAAAHRAYGQLHPSIPRVPPKDPHSDRDLRIGFLSADLRTHSVGFFIEPLLERAPPWARLSCFSLVAAPSDPMARRFRSLVPTWEEVGHLDDAGLAGAIKRAGVDVLVELMGHTGGNRLSALTKRPAPIVVSAIGYPNTTGLDALDYRIVDSITDPPGAEALSTEKLLRLDPCFLCYRPPSDAPPPTMPDPSGPITFGSFNAPTKIGRETAELWAGTMRAVPGSRLVLKYKELGNIGFRDEILRRLAAAGIDPKRIEILPATATIAEHLALYSRVHIALDTIPYNGTTTTCEALLMGVPVVTLTGDRHASRVGMSLLSAIGLERLISKSGGEFTAIAAELAGDLAHLKHLRESLRQRVMRSALCDSASYAERFYRAVRTSWRSLVSGKGTIP